MYGNTNAMAQRNKRIQHSGKISRLSRQFFQEKTDKTILRRSNEKGRYSWKNYSAEDPFKKISHKEVMKVARKYRKHLIAKGISIKKMYLFGSYAKGKAHYGSDIDICIIIPRIKNRSKWQVKCAMDAQGISGVIQPFVYAPSHFIHWSNSLANEILSTGIEIT